MEYGNVFEILLFFGLIPLLILVVRLLSFARLKTVDLPNIAASDFKRMKLFSGIAFGLFWIFFLSSFFAYFFCRDGRGPFWQGIILVTGIVTAGGFDLYAGKIKKLGEPFDKPSEDLVRWYHVILALCVPFVGLPWGIVRILKGKNKTGIVLLLFGSYWYWSMLLAIS